MNTASLKNTQPSVTQTTHLKYPPSPQVLMDKNPHITTVVNKLGTIENEYR